MAQQFSNNDNFGAAVALDMIVGTSSQNVDAFQEGVPFNMGEVILSSAGPYNQNTFPFLDDAGEAIQVDGYGGADQTILIRGLDPEGLEQFIPVTLSGNSTIPVPGLWRRVNGAFNASGTPITTAVPVQRASNGDDILVVTVEDQKASSAVWTIPSNRRASVFDFITTMFRDANGGSSATGRIKARAPGGVFITQFWLGLQKDGDSSPEFDNQLPEIAPPLTDIIYTIDTTDSGTAISSRMALLLFDC